MWPKAEHPRCSPQGRSPDPLPGTPRRVALLTIGPCSSGLASSSSWGPLKGCSEPGQGPRTGALQARDGADGNPIRERGEIPAPSSRSVSGSRPSARMPHSPSFRAGLRSPSLPPSSSALVHLLLPPLPLALFLSFLPPPRPRQPLPSSLRPRSPPFLGWEPRPHPPLQPPGLASQAAVPEARLRLSPQLPPGRDDAASSSGKRPGLTWDHVQTY